MRQRQRCVEAWLGIVLLAGCTLIAAAEAQDRQALAGRALVEALRQGGFNVYFRHAATDWSLHDEVTEPGDWTSCDAERMRQLAPEGREAARRVGEAMGALGIPVGRVLASPYCRTVETARLLALGSVETTTDIMNTRVAEYFGGVGAIAERARKRLAEPPPRGTNTVLVAHGNVLRAATEVYPQETEAIVFSPDGNGGYTVVARISPREWARLAIEFPAKR